MAGKRRKNSDMNLPSQAEYVYLHEVPSPSAMMDDIVNRMKEMPPNQGLKVQIPKGRTPNAFRSGLRNGLESRGLTNLAFTIGSDSTGEYVYVWNSYLVHPGEGEATQESTSESAGDDRAVFTFEGTSTSKGTPST